MTSKGMTSKKGKVEDQWIFKSKEVTETQLLEIVGRCLEIAIRIIFGNFTYNFGGRIFLQEEGGPIGNRLTMACSRLVMQDWGEKYKELLENEKVWITMLKIYVDDVRQISTVLEKGTRYDEEKKRMVWTKEAMEEGS